MKPHGWGDAWQPLAGKRRKRGRRDEEEEEGNSLESSESYPSTSGSSSLLLDCDDGAAAQAAAAPAQARSGLSSFGRSLSEAAGDEERAEHRDPVRPAGWGKAGGSPRG